MEINFYFSEQARKRLTWDDLDTIEMMQEGEVSTRRLRSLCARYMVDGNNVYLPHAKAMKLLGVLTEEEIQQTIKAFVEAMGQAALPKANGNSSGQPSEVAQVSEFPTGSEH